MTLVQNRSTSTTSVGAPSKTITSTTTSPGPAGTAEDDARLLDTGDRLTGLTEGTLTLLRLTEGDGEADTTTLPAARDELALDGADETVTLEPVGPGGRLEDEKGDEGRGAAGEAEALGLDDARPTDRLGEADAEADRLLDALLTWAADDGDALALTTALTDGDLLLDALGTAEAPDETLTDGLALTSRLLLEGTAEGELALPGGLLDTLTVRLDEAGVLDDDARAELLEMIELATTLEAAGGAGLAEGAALEVGEDGVTAGEEKADDGELTPRLRAEDCGLLPAGLLLAAGRKNEEPLGDALGLDGAEELDEPVTRFCSQSSRPWIWHSVRLPVTMNNSSRSCRLACTPLMSYWKPELSPLPPGSAEALTVTPLRRAWVSAPLA